MYTGHKRTPPFPKKKKKKKKKKVKHVTSMRSPVKVGHTHCVEAPPTRGQFPLPRPPLSSGLVTDSPIAGSSEYSNPAPPPPQTDTFPGMLPPVPESYGPGLPSVRTLGPFSPAFGSCKLIRPHFVGATACRYGPGHWESGGAQWLKNPNHFYFCAFFVLLFLDYYFFFFFFFGEIFCEYGCSSSLQRKLIN